MLQKRGKYHGHESVVDSTFSGEEFKAVRKVARCRATMDASADSSAAEGPTGSGTGKEQVQWLGLCQGHTTWDLEALGGKK